MTTQHAFDSSDLDVETLRQVCQRWRQSRTDLFIAPRLRARRLRRESAARLVEFRRELAALVAMHVRA